MQAENPYLDYLIDLSFQGLKRLFVLFMMVAFFFSFDQLVKNDMRTNDNIRKITSGQGDDYTATCLINYIIISQKLQNGSKRFKQTRSAWCWPKSNTANWFEWKSNSWNINIISI